MKMSTQTGSFSSETCDSFTIAYAADTSSITTTIASVSTVGTYAFNHFTLYSSTTIFSSGSRLG
jgi:hypothetical protein